MPKLNQTQRLKVYNYTNNGYCWILIKPQDLSEFIKLTPMGYFPRIFINTENEIIGSYESGLNGKPDQRYHRFFNAEIIKTEKE